MDCLFCKIAGGEIPSKIAFEDPELIVIHDIKPQAPIHMLVLPKQHIATINNVDSENEKLLGRMIVTAKKMAKAEKISEDGYRLVFNVNSGGGQDVYHIHLHILGGRQMSWPPG
ncbi:MAG: histidine triad nucleotide-binding protein [Tatlockia sp.]|nr:histidine triad nucleotide-binding protein [Tatlockia sp.]